MSYLRPAAWAYLVCLSLSVLLCVLSLWQLWTLRKAMTRRLFWIQLVLLTLTDLLFSGFSLTWRVLRWADVFPTSLDGCHWLWTVRVSMEFFSCMLEVHIAAGFAIACFHNKQCSTLLWRALPLTFPLAVVLSFAIEPDLKIRAGCRFTQLHDYDSMMGWIIVVCSCCGLAVIFYIASAIKTTSAPMVIRRRARLRGLTYVLNFLLTWGLRALCHIFFVYPMTLPIRTFHQITGDCIALNGALNVVTYNVWMWYTRRLSTHASLIGDTGDSTALEDCVIDRYFDLDVYSDEFVFEAQQRVALSIASVQAILRAESSGTIGTSLQPASWDDTSSNVSSIPSRQIA